MMSAVCRHLKPLPCLSGNRVSLPARSMLVCCVLLGLMTTRSLIAAAATTGRRLPQTNPLILLDADDEDSTTSSQRGASNERGTGGSGPLSPDEILTPESGEPYEVTEKQYLRGDWCKTLPLKQRIDVEGCVSRIITNRLCYGQCNSFYIPKQSSDFNDAFRSCSFCKPYRITTFTVNLRCPGQTPSIQRRRVEKVKQCRCVAVDVS
ncbi:gremlin-1-like [Acanthaster planci]|uniref:Gremlin-1 n=1 Tax=Acanthaster planci TaxID=133434 RepID=A0A8B7ZN84_ACAPL|nr:gremlin-1-like [Acanthaster planci]